MPLPAAAFILQGNSDFGALSGFNKELSECLRELRVEPFLVDLLDVQDSLNTINKVLRDYGRNRIVAAFSFSGIGMELGGESPESNVWQLTKIPVVSWMMDHPCYILKRHALSLSALLRIYPSMDYVNFQRDYIRASGRNILSRMGVFTHGTQARQREPRKDESPLIVFAKAWGDIEGLSQLWKKLPLNIQRITNDSISHYWDTTKRQSNVVDSVLVVARSYGLELHNDVPLLSFLVSQVDTYCRWRKAEILVKDLLKLPVRIYSKNIERIKSDNHKATLLPSISYPDLMEEYRRAIAVISMNPNSDDGCHDRVYSAFGAGALPVSDTNPWWEDKFPELRPYSYDFCERSVAEAIDNILGDPAKAADTGWSVGAKMRAERPFLTAVKEAIDWALTQRYFEMDFLTPLETYVR